ncbi:11762_t:CDS:2 [Paraglomus brasilianum]|uniref:11762_t:CDS:1 n=1 Tax=Paraglomus brasilianum TaxID=144538 RepID=A0A9N9ALK4_9GLOM|nr:11762_t:CDS:2 [Paraglomus brasilianum]
MSDPYRDRKGASITATYHPRWDVRKIKRVYDKSTLWCSKKCSDNTPNWLSLVGERSNQPRLVGGQQNSVKGRDYSPCLLKVPPTSQKFYEITCQFETAYIEDTS